MIQQTNLAPLDKHQPADRAVVAPAVTQIDAGAAAANDLSFKEQPVAANDPTFAQKWLPQWAKDVLDWIHEKVAKARKWSIQIMPAVLVNTCSNWLAVMHIGTEVAMFKSGMGGKPMVKDWSNPVNWVWQPAQAIYKDIVSKNRSQDFTLKKLFEGNPFKNFHTYVLDPVASTERAIVNAPVSEEMKLLKIGSPWQTRTTGTGLIIWSLSAIIPERKESDEEIERMAKMRTLHPFQYIGERLKQAVWFPQWNTHKREMLGLGYLGIGTLSTIGSWSNRAAMVAVDPNRKDDVPYVKELVETRIAEIKAMETEGKLIGKAGEVLKGDLRFMESALKKGQVMTQRFSFNKGYLFTSIVSFVAGLPLLFALDERKAYSSYGSLSVFRIPFLFKSIGEKMDKGEAGWQYYAGSKISFQVEDGLFSLIGGAEKKKRADGTYEIIDHEMLKKKARIEAKQEKLKNREVRLEKEMEHTEKAMQTITNGKEKDTETSNPQPTLKISQIASHEMAMPERAQAHEQNAATTV